MNYAPQSGKEGLGQHTFAPQAGHRCSWCGSQHWQHGAVAPLPTAAPLLQLLHDCIASSASGHRWLNASAARHRHRCNHRCVLYTTAPSAHTDVMRRDPGIILHRLCAWLLKETARNAFNVMSLANSLRLQCVIAQKIELLHCHVVQSFYWVPANP